MPGAFQVGPFQTNYQQNAGGGWLGIYSVLKINGLSWAFSNEDGLSRKTYILQDMGDGSFNVTITTGFSDTKSDDVIKETYILTIL